MNIKIKKLKKLFLNNKICSNKPNINNDSSINNSNNLTLKKCPRAINKNIKKSKLSLKKFLFRKEDMNKKHISDKNKDKDNIKYNKSLKYNNSLSFIDFNRNKYNNSNSILSNNKTSLSIYEKNALNSIVNKFNENKSATYLLLDKDKRMELNSLSNITNKSLTFLLSDEGNENKKYNSIKNNKKCLSKENDSNLISSKMVDLFNNRTCDLLDKSRTSYKMFSKNKTQFRIDLINAYNNKNSKNSKEIIKKLKRKYNEAVDIYENQKNLQRQKALKEEKDFYKLKNEEDLKTSNHIYKRLSFENKRKNGFRQSIVLPGRKMSFKISNSNLKRFSIGIINNFSSAQNLLINNLKNEKNNLSALWNLKHNLMNKKLFINESEKQFYKAHRKYEHFQEKKIKQNAVKFSNLIKDLINSNNILKTSNYLDKESKKIKIIYNDIVRLSKIKKINASVNKIEIDEFQNDCNKLRQKMNKCEDEYYRVSTINNKYNLSYLKPILKSSTIKKYLSLKDSNFGIP